MNLEEKAKEIRRYILETALREGKGHVASSLSWVEIAVALFYGAIHRTDDRFVLSKAHGHLTLDAIFEDLGADDYGKMMWPGWPYKCSGSLGQGLSIAAGMALSKKISNEPGRVFCVLSDAELHEGAIWEAVMFAAHHKLNNLVAIIDNNRQSCANWTRDVLDIESLYQKFTAFGWYGGEMDGHNVALIQEWLADPQPWRQSPLCLVARTVKGKGIPFMEGNPAWHHYLPKGEQIEEARKALA